MTDQTQKIDTIILAKIAIIERCLIRIKEEYVGHETTLKTNYTQQDSIILNLQRACEAAIDLGNYIVKKMHLGLPQESREVFSLLANAKMINPEVSTKMQKMVGFRNIAIHEYQKLEINILQLIITNHLQDFKEFAQQILQGIDTN